MRQLDREGIFKATPIQWGISTTESSQSVALVVVYRILAQFDAGTWVDWSEFEEHQMTGYHYFIGREGSINTKNMNDLVLAIGWDGNLDLSGGPQDIVCQITVESEDYNGQSRLRVKWLNPENFAPGPKTLDANTAKALQARYGSQLRAAAAAAKPKHTATTKATPPPPRPAPAPTPEVAEDDLPFEHRPAVVSGEPAVGLGAGARPTTTSGGLAVREQPAPAPQLATTSIDQARIDRQIDQHVELTMLEAMGFVEIPKLEAMSIDQLRSLANSIRASIDTGERRLLQSAFADGDKEKALRALKIIYSRKAA